MAPEHKVGDGRMKLITVNCWRPDDDDDVDPRLAVTIAATETDAKNICQDAYSSDGFIRFEIDRITEWRSAGPARVLGYTGQGPWSWES